MKEITLQELSQLPPTEQQPYAILMKSIKPNKTLRIKFSNKFVAVKPKYTELWDFPYEDIITLKQAVAQSNEVEVIAEILSTVYNVNRYDLIAKMSVTSSFEWVLHEMKQLLQIENEYLNTFISEKEKQAGVEELNRFGFFASIDSLNPDITKHEAILKLPYAQVFEKLCYNKTVAEINERMIKNDSRKV